MKRCDLLLEAMRPITSFLIVNFCLFAFAEPTTNTYKALPKTPDPKVRRADVAYRVLLNESFIDGYRIATSDEYVAKSTDMIKKVGFH